MMAIKNMFFRILFYHMLQCSEAKVGSTVRVQFIQLAVTVELELQCSDPGLAGNTLPQAVDARQTAATAGPMAPPSMPAALAHRHIERHSRHAQFVEGCRP